MKELKSISFAGQLYLQRYINGVLSDQLIGPLAGSKFTIKSESDVKTRKSKGREDYGQIVGVISVSKPTMFGITVDAADVKTLGLLFLGSDAPLSMPSGTVTAESRSLPHGVWVKLDHRNVSSVVITGKVLDVDYEVNPKIGAIRALATGALANNAVASIAYAYAAITGVRIAGGSTPKIEVALIFQGRNLEDDSNVYGEVAKLLLSPKSDIDLLSEDFATAEFEGTAIKMDGKPEHTFDLNVLYA